MLAFAFVIGVLVFKFSLGFGPRLVGFTRGDTEYCISIVPLGGYVKMAGENAEDPRSGQPDEFLSKTKWQRFQVLIMGPVMNLLLAVVLLAVVLAQGADVPAYLDQPPVIGGIEKSSPAERAGFKPGDRVLTVEGRHVETWESFDVAIGTQARRALSVTVNRAGTEQSLTVTPDAHGKLEVGRIGVFPQVHPRGSRSQRERGSP